MGEEQKTENLPYSYHTFLFPFMWEGEKDSFNKLEPKWVSKVKAENDEIQRLQYNEWQYFHDNVRKALYDGNDEKDNIVKVFSYKDAKDYNYTIKKDNKIYELKINDIKLNVYNTGIAILIFELENWNNKSVDDVKKINEYGRRVSIPFLSEDYKCSLTADEISIEKIMKENEDGKSAENRSFRCKYTEMKASRISKKYDFLSNIILDILGKNFVFDKFEPLNKEQDDGGNMRGSQPTPKDILKCNPISDDRMFVIFAITDNSDFKHLFLYDERDKVYSWEKQCLHKTNQFLYELIFVDGGCASCQDRQMRLKLLKEHLYARWIEEGTIHAVTDHSFILITDGQAVKQEVLLPFLSHYTKMAILVLAQRASIIAMNLKASEIASQKSYNSDCYIELHKKYNKFQNQLLFFEVTAQEQGIELYQMMQKCLYIDQEQEILEKRIKNMYEIRNVENAEKLNKESKDLNDKLYELSKESNSLNNKLYLLTIYGSIFAAISILLGGLSVWIDLNIPVLLSSTLKFFELVKVIFSYSTIFILLIVGLLAWIFIKKSVVCKK